MTASELALSVGTTPPTMRKWLRTLHTPHPLFARWDDYITPSIIEQARERSWL